MNYEEYIEHKQQEHPTEQDCDKCYNYVSTFRDFIEATEVLGE